MGRARFAKKVFFRNEEGNKRLIQDLLPAFPSRISGKEKLGSFFTAFTQGKREGGRRQFFWTFTRGGPWDFGFRDATTAKEFLFFFP